MDEPDRFGGHLRRIAEAARRLTPRISSIAPDYLVYYDVPPPGVPPPGQHAGELPWAWPPETRS